MFTTFRKLKTKTNHKGQKSVNMQIVQASCNFVEAKDSASGGKVSLSM